MTPDSYRDNKYLHMKNIKILGLFILIAFGAVSCETDDNLMVTSAVPSENVEFTNTFLNEYILTPETRNNIAERFVWNSPDFGIATPNGYDLEASITEDFSEITSMGSTAENNMGVTINQMLSLATLAGLDNDPNTEDLPNTGSLYFRVRAYMGDGGANAPESISPVATLQVRLPEASGPGSGIGLSPWGVVGSAANDWGATPDLPFYTTSNANVIVAYVDLIDGEIKFRQNNEWGGDFGDANDDGILDQDADNNIPVTAGTYKITIDWSDNSYSIEAFYWGLVGSATPNGWDGPDVKLQYDYSTDTFKAVVQLVAGEVKVRMNDTWGGDYGDGNQDGVLDQDPDNNITVTAGYYLVTVNFSTLEYSIEATNIWGLVGSATPNGWDGPDTKFVPDFSNPGVWIIDSITLVDGEIKVRPNDKWENDYGDANLDGILDRDPDNNIAVTAGTYKITVDFSDESAPTYTLEEIIIL